MYHKLFFVSQFDCRRVYVRETIVAVINNKNEQYSPKIQ